MNQQQNVFALVTGATLGVVGSFLATNAIADWSLATVGLGLMALAGAQCLQQFSTTNTESIHGRGTTSQSLQAL